MNFDPEKITFFAKTDARGSQVPFGIKAKDRTRHMYVIGKTGMGKSTLLENMAVQDMQSGEGMAFIDPHGQTAEVLLDYIPEHRKDDVLYFAPFDAENPVAFNIMEDVGPERRHLVVSGLMSVFKKIWIDAWSARMEYILQNTLLALLEYPDSTLLGVNRMLSDKKYRRKVIDNISDPAVKSFWVDEFLNYNERYMQEAGDSIKNKIGQFTANPLIRNIIGQPKSSFDLRKIMDEKKILIMNLSKGLIGESNANLLGSMLTTRIYLAAMSRADLSVEEMKNMPNFYFYVDEFQSFANATFADILSEARKYKLNLTIAHQYIEQMEEEVRNAVFGNVGTIVSFRVGPFDAETLETIYAPQFYAVDICNLGFAQVYLTLMIDGIGSKPFSAQTLPPIELKSESCKQMVIHSSRVQFAFPRPEVEEKINAWHASEDSTHGGGSNQGQGQNQNNQQSNSQNRGQNTNGGARQFDRPKLPSRNNQSTGSQPRPDRPRAETSERNNSPRPVDNSRGEQRSRDNAGLRSNIGSSRPEQRPKDGSYPSRDTSNQNNESTNTSEKKPEKHLEDLRSILKGLTEADRVPKDKIKSKPAESAKQKSSEIKTEKNPAVKPEANPLRAALASVLEEKPKPTEEKKDERLTGLPDESFQKKQTDFNKSVDRENIIETKPQVNIVEDKDSKPKTPEDTKLPTSVESLVKNESSNNQDQLDPKKLERMMRVTTSDKTPLK